MREITEHRITKAERRTSFAVIGIKGAIEFWFTDYQGQKYGGVEQHNREPEDYQKENDPREYCDLLSGKCWHDGSSLYAKEYFIPLYENVGEMAVFRKLEAEYFSRYYPDGD